MKSIVKIEKAVADLTAARAILSQPKAWVQGAMAEDREGNTVPVKSPKAICFCSVGALAKAAGVKPSRIQRTAASKYLADVAGVYSWESDDNLHRIIGANDHSTVKHKHILMMFDFAILQAKDDLKAAKKAAR